MNLNLVSLEPYTLFVEKSKEEYLHLASSYPLALPAPPIAVAHVAMTVGLLSSLMESDFKMGAKV